MLFDCELHLETYYGRILNSHMWTWFKNQKYRRQNELFGKMYNFEQNASDQYKNITGLSCAKGPSLNEAERQSIHSNQYKSNTEWLQCMYREYIKMNVNRAPMIFRLVWTVIEMWIGHC